MKLNALPTLEALLENADLICVPVARDGLDDIYASVLQKIIPAASLPPVSEWASSKSGNTLFFAEWKEKRVKVLVQWEGESLTEGLAYTLNKKMAIRAKAEHADATAIYVQHLSKENVLRAAINGWVAGQYDLGLFKKSEDQNVRNDQGMLRVCLPSGDNTSMATQGITLGLVQHEIMTLVNMPASHKSPAYLGHWAQRSAATYRYSAEVLDKDKLNALGMFAILAVNRGSEQPAQLIITHYKHPDAKKKVAFIGKGVIFDTGGLSIKDSRNMHYMKSDMAGAAAALGTVEACARLALPVDVMAITPVTDNSVDALSTKPGDVITSYSGKTIEIIDTDAEGRLVLADALAYAVKQYAPDVMIDLATLTGSIVAALGPQAGGLFTKNDELAASLTRAGDQSGERVWRMPMFDEYHEDMVSDIADIRNLSEKPYAGSITAAKFLEAFTSAHPAWAHLDIAGMGFQPNGFGKSYCATAYGIRLLIRWLENEQN